jgi:hypothetical protein
LQPSRIILIEGVEPTDQRFYEPNKDAVKELQKIFRAEVMQISANDPNKAKEQLDLMLRRETKLYNVAVSPMNTKLQAVGLYLAWESNPQIQIVIALPDKFGAWLTKGIKEVKRYHI